MNGRIGRFELRDLVRRFADIEARWMDDLAQGFEAGAVAVGATLGYVDFRFPNKDWRSAHPRLAAWFAQASEKSSMKATFPQG